MDPLRLLLSRQDLEALLDLVEPHLPGQPANATRRNNLSGCRVFLRWAFDQGLPLLNPPPTLGQAYLAFLNHKHPDTPASVINRLAHARNLYAAFHALGAPTPDPFADLDAPSNDPALHKRAYTDAEVQRLLAHADPLHQTLVLLGAHAGLTGPEVARLHWHHVAFDQGVLSLHGRQVPTSPQLHAALEHFALTQGVTLLFGGQGKLFPTLHNDHHLRAALFHLCLAANVPYKAWRALRNHAGLRLLTLTHDEALVAQHLGLSTLKAVHFIQRAIQRGMGADHTQ